jgi:prophage maintenance system killer protein
MSKSLWENLAQNSPFIDASKRARPFAATYTFLAANSAQSRRKSMKTML